MRTFSKPILGVEEYEGTPASALLRFALASGRFTVPLDSFIFMILSRPLLIQPSIHQMNNINK
jgi:hypothetical protein